MSNVDGTLPSIPVSAMANGFRLNNGEGEEVEANRLVLVGAEEAGMKGWRERAADIFAKHG